MVAGMLKQRHQEIKNQIQASNCRAEFGLE